VDVGEKLGTIKPNEHYFQVLINEIYLANYREWFSTYDPMLFIVSEFNYGQKKETVPYIVGPSMIESMIEKYGQKAPPGMIFSDTRVTGLHPYRGDGLTLSLILFQIKRDAYPRKFMQIFENAAKVLDFTTMLSTYVKVAGIVLDGVESMLNKTDVQPLIGLRKEFPSDVFESQYFALVNMPESKFNPNELWVRNGQLVHGDNLPDAKPYRDSDYVLFSINRTSERDDVETLPFYPLWNRVVEEARVAKEDNWESAKTAMSNLYLAMRLSPDITESHAEALADDYITKMQAIQTTACKIAKLGDVKTKPSELDGIRAKSLSILKM
jgi:hypothetical protein